MTKEKLTLSIDPDIKRRGKAFFARLPNMNLSQFLEEKITQELNKGRKKLFSSKWMGIVSSQSDFDMIRLDHIRKKHLK
jgi:hypothetical protein